MRTPQVRFKGEGPLVNKVRVYVAGNPEPGELTFDEFCSMVEELQGLRDAMLYGEHPNIPFDYVYPAET